MRLGIIDVGTHSIHFLIVTAGRGGTLRTILRQRHLARLGQGGLVNNRLTTTSMDRAVRTLRSCAAMLRRLKVDRVEAVATSAVRDARNGAAFVRRVRNTLALPLRILPGTEEARLIFLGVTHRRSYPEPLLMVTIGGGSAQVVAGWRGRVHIATSLPLGAARLAQRFIRHDPAQPRELRALRQWVTQHWRPVTQRLARRRWATVLGCSAALWHLMDAAARRRAVSDQRVLRMTRTHLSQVIDWLARSTAQERRRLLPQEPLSEALLLPAAVTLAVWMEQCGVHRLRFAPGSLREGLVRTVLDEPSSAR